MGRKPAVYIGHKGKGTHVGFAAKELEQTQYGVNIVKGGATEMFGAQKSEKSRK